MTIKKTAGKAKPRTVAQEKTSTTHEKSAASQDKAPPGKRKTAAEEPHLPVVVMESRGRKDRREAADRRQKDAPVPVERRAIARREKVNRRRQIDPTTCERDYTVEEVEFMSALDDYKRTSGRMFPTCSEILEVIRGLGYAKPTLAPPAIGLPELATTPVMVEQAV